MTRFLRYHRKIILVGMLVGMNACSLQKLAIRQMSPILDHGFESVNEEADLVLAEQSVPANLKLLEGLIKGDPGNEHLILLASQGYFSYSLGFVEDQSPDRARELYRRGRDYGIRVLSEHPSFRSSWDKDLDSFTIAVQQLGDKDVPAAFWTLTNWAMYINFSKTDPDALADFPKIGVLADLVIKHDERFFYGGAHMVMGTLLGSLPKMFGGNTGKAREHFEKCFQINEGKFLIAQVYYAKSVGVMTQDQELYESVLKKVIEAPVNILKEQTLANQIAKRKAKWLLEHTSDYF